MFLLSSGPEAIISARSTHIRWKDNRAVLFPNPVEAQVLQVTRLRTMGNIRSIQQSEGRHSSWCELLSSSKWHCHYCHIINGGESCCLSPKVTRCYGKNKYSRGEYLVVHRRVNKRISWRSTQGIESKCTAVIYQLLQPIKIADVHESLSYL